jgi:cytidyltransferase-like protein
MRMQKGDRTILFQGGTMMRATVLALYYCYAGVVLFCTPIVDGFVVSPQGGALLPSPPPQIRRRHQESHHHHRCFAHQYQHALAILTMPNTSKDRIANEAVIESILPKTNKLSVVVRCPGPPTTTSTASLRRYVGEIYSQLWDVSIGSTDGGGDPNLPDAVVYPQNLPNAAPESWIAIQTDLDVICGLADTVAFYSSETFPKGVQERRVETYRKTSGTGGLEAHVENINQERIQRGLLPVTALPVDTVLTKSLWKDPQVVFVDDDEEDEEDKSANQDVKLADDNDDDDANGSFFLAGAAPDPDHVFDSVCVGGTFDGLHYGHRKLLTLAVSSVTPIAGRLYVGVTADEMLRSKAYAEYIPSCDVRMASVRAFLNRLAPGMIDRVRIRPIVDAYGPAGHPGERFDALVLSHETLHTGQLLNQHRAQNLGLAPLQLLCTRRTEAHGMSSTALRRLRSQQQERLKTV